MSKNIENSNKLLEFKEVSFSYKNNHKIINNINLILQPKQKIGIIGENGSGKSTITKLILGINVPQKGCVNLFGKEVSWKEHYPLLGYIGDPSHNPQELGLPIGTSVEEIYNTFKNLSKYSSKQKEILIPKDQLEKLKNDLNIENLFKRDIRELSKGERRRLMAFLALGKQIKLLIADEATEGLDDKGKDKLLNLIIERTNNQDDFSMLWISHCKSEINCLTDTKYRIKYKQLIKIEDKKFEECPCKKYWNISNY